MVKGMARNGKIRRGYLLIWHATLWSIWRAYNNAIFASGVFSPRDIVEEIKVVLKVSSKLIGMEKKITLVQTVATAGVFSAISFWYGFMFGRESSRKELSHLIEDLRRGNPTPPPPPHS
ncbi:putative membrane lipoprotein [Trifolium repens]|nr:putative membrane lipoprotein [Trifolium repens]